MKCYKVDIVMATFQGECFVEEQIKSILNQSYSDFNLYIRDDFSSDKTIEIIKFFTKKDSRVILIDDDYGNVGVKKNFEILLSKTNSRYIMFSDQDDIWLINKIEKHLKNILECEERFKDEKIFVSYSDVKIVNEDLKVLNNNMYPKNGLKMTLSNILYTQGAIQGSSMMINSELKKLMLPFPDNIQMHDSLASYLVVFFGQACYINEPLMYYRQHASNALGVKRLDLLGLIKRVFTREKFFINKTQILQTRMLYKLHKKRLNAEQIKDIQNFFKFISSNKMLQLLIAFRYSYMNRNSRLKLIFKILTSKKEFS